MANVVSFASSATGGRLICEAAWGNVGFDSLLGDAGWRKVVAELPLATVNSYLKLKCLHLRKTSVIIVLIFLV